MAGVGGRRPGAGRKAGTPGKVKAVLAEAAREYTDKALKVLVDVMEDKTAPHAARVSAANGVLDRGHGKPAQAVQVGGEGGGPIKVTISGDDKGLL